MVWEYKMIVIRTEGAEADAIETLDSCGQKGWELVAVLPAGYFIRYIFKKLKT